MAIVNNEGRRVSYESKHILRKLKDIVKVEGKQGNVLVLTENIRGVQIIIDIFSLKEAKHHPDLPQMMVKDCYLQLRLQDCVI